MDAQGNKGAPSPVASFTWLWPSATTPRLADLVDAPEVMDPRFSWDAVPGAARYEVEVNSSQDFAAGSKVCCSSTPIATSLTPTVLFKDNVYYWRIRAIDPDGNAGIWNVGPSFTKAFAKSPPVTAPVVKNLLRDNLADPGTDVDSGTPGYQTNADRPLGSSARCGQLSHRGGPVLSRCLQLDGQPGLEVGRPDGKHRLDAAGHALEQLEAV